MVTAACGISTQCSPVLESNCTGNEGHVILLITSNFIRHRGVKFRYIQIRGPNFNNMLTDNSRCSYEKYRTTIDIITKI